MNIYDRKAGGKVRKRYVYDTGRDHEKPMGGYTGIKNMVT